MNIEGVELDGIEPTTSGLQSPRRVVQVRLAHPALGLGPRRLTSVVGRGRFELPTSRLSGVRSNQLSYRP